MSKLDELDRLADEAYRKGCETEAHLGYDDKMAGTYVVQIRNDTIKQMVAIMRQMRDVLPRSLEYALECSHKATQQDCDEIAKALAAFDKFDKGE